MFTLTNPQGLEIRAIAYGGIITSIRTPDRDGRIDDIALGFDTAEDYRRNPAYFGAIIGRYANRIAHARFTLDGAAYRLAENNAPNHLHGGARGFDKVVWDARAFESAAGTGVVFRHTSPDGEEGYPGNVEAEVTYTLTSRNELVVDYLATTDKATPVSLTQHTYFNLAGAGNGDVRNHQLTISADRYTPVDRTQIPTGAVAPVDGTPFDFRQARAIGERIDDRDAQLAIGGGYDHNFVIHRSGPGLTHAARVFEPASGRVLDVATTEPGVQFYTANKLGQAGRDGRAYGPRAGFCLETQRFPDSPNQPSFPSAILRPGEKYRSQTVFTFSARH